MAIKLTNMIAIFLLVLLAIRCIVIPVPALRVARTSTDKYNGKLLQKQPQKQQRGLMMTPPSDWAAMVPADSKDEDQANEKAQQQQRGDIVISFGLCLSRDAQRQGQKELGQRHPHGEKPYDVAAALTTRLWKQQDPSLKVVVTLAYRGPADQADLDRVTGMIQRAGGLVWSYDVGNTSNPDLACVRASQMGRMFLWDSGGLVQPNDYVVTSDADLMPINASKLLAPVRAINAAGRSYRVWVGRFTEGIRSGFPMAFLGASAADWQVGLQRSGLTNYNMALELATTVTNYPWGFDQVVATVAIMNTMACRFSAGSFFWNTENIIPDLQIYNKSGHVEIDDTMTCIRGSAGAFQWKEAQCLNQVPPVKDLHNLKCVYAHFLPHANAIHMQRAYETIASFYPNPILYSDIKAAATA